MFADTSSPKKLRKKINKVLGREKAKTETIKSIKIGDTVLTNDTDKASVLNPFFTEIGHKITEKLPLRGDIDSLNTLQPNVNSILLSSVTKD